jgi:hypothetical protein
MRESSIFSRSENSRLSGEDLGGGSAATGEELTLVF